METLKFRFFTGFCLLAVFSATIFAQAKGPSKNKTAGRRVAIAREQTNFGSETEINNKVKVPGDVLEQLGEYENGRLKECQSGNWAEKNQSDHFAASRININGDKQSDLIVQAQTLCFMGAHNTTFWIFTEIGQRLSPGYELAFDTRADFLRVLKTSTNGYRDIETASHTAVELFTTLWKFDGQKYQPRECKIENFTTKKISKVKCNY